MFNDTNLKVVSPAPKARKYSSAAAKLIQAAALAAVLVPLGSVAAEASTCTFGSEVSGCAIGPQGGLLFDFGIDGSAPYKVELVFDQIFGQFDVSIDDSENTYEAITARFAEFFPLYQPLPIGTNLAAPFISFAVTAPTPCTGTQEECANATNTWRSEGARGTDAVAGYDLWIYWLAETDPLFPSPSVLHDTGETEQDGQFDINITQTYLQGGVQCGVFSPCIGLLAASIHDPAIGGRDDMFFDFTLADDNGIAVRAVPEPATLVLLGTGISSLLYRRRRLSQDAATPPTL
jgi:hypothetical protein